MQRFPDGLKGEGWNARVTPDSFPDWIERVNYHKKEGGSFDAPIVGGKAALVYLADQAVVTLHTYFPRADDLDRPEKMVSDLEPPEGTEDYAKVREVVLYVNDLMAELT